ncbi:hypothetical protein MSG28_012556 [Choristoneura fumiferana]|uniref:Uncharacterized protein n=1 Tax=Choristoneura fumiferana TaxID=7141 RepID=A0ACC0JGZ1_CHOFU|nr:hypothetical protein MSG28_012556 [Choristoneura fumiferana]
MCTGPSSTTYTRVLATLPILTPPPSSLAVRPRSPRLAIDHNTHIKNCIGPPTPCPARVEYATPVFARNYQGVWRYVVQIPYEGYFTQTVEVTRCMQSRCHYLDGGCLSSPRWVSLLVGELHYPAPAAPAPAAGATPTPTQQARPYNDQQYQEYQQYLQKRAGAPADAPGAAPDKPAHCDGHDEMGCFQVRLYYDWFLVPGSCKCWRPDYFARYVRRRNAGEL